MSEHSNDKAPQKKPACGDNFTERFASMSPSEIAEEMEARLGAMTEETYDPDVIDAYLDELDRRAPMSYTFDVEKSYADLQARLRSFLPEEAPPTPASVSSAPKAQKGRRGKIPRQSIKILLIATALLLGTMMVAQAADLNIFGRLAQWTEEQFWFRPEEGRDTSSDFEAYRQALADNQLPEELSPSWYPEGYQPGELEFFENAVEISVQITFTSETNGRYFCVSLNRYNDSTSVSNTLYEKDSTPVEQYTNNNGQTFYILSNIDRNLSTWSEGNMVETIRGTLSVDELKKILDSIGGK